MILIPAFVGALTLVPGDHAAKLESPPIAELSRLFVDACLNGHFNSTAGSRPARASEIESPAKGERRILDYMLFRPLRAQLRVTESDSQNDRGWLRTCEIRGNIYSLSTAWRVVSQAVLGRADVPYAANNTMLSIDYPAAGYLVAVSEQFLSVEFYTSGNAKRQIKANRSDQPILRAIDWNKVDWSRQ